MVRALRLDLVSSEGKKPTLGEAIRGKRRGGPVREREGGLEHTGLGNFKERVVAPNING